MPEQTYIIKRIPDGSPWAPMRQYLEGQSCRLTGGPLSHLHILTGRFSGQDLFILNVNLVPDFTSLADEAEEQFQRQRRSGSSIRYTGD